MHFENKKYNFYYKLGNLLGVYLGFMVFFSIIYFLFMKQFFIYLYILIVGISFATIYLILKQGYKIWKG